MKLGPHCLTVYLNKINDINHPIPPKWLEYIRLFCSLFWYRIYWGFSGGPYSSLAPEGLGVDMDPSGEHIWPLKLWLEKSLLLLSGPLLKWPKHKVALKMMLILLQGSSFGCWCFPEGICMFLYAVNWQLHLQLLILSFSNRWQVQETRQLTIPYQFDGSHDSWNSSFIFFYLFVFKWIDTSGWC